MIKNEEMFNKSLARGKFVNFVEDRRRLTILPFSSNFHAERKILEITQSYVFRLIIQFVGIRKLRVTLRFLFLFSLSFFFFENVITTGGCRNAVCKEGRRKEKKGK